jgi:DNA-binding CsgD family transcriptional regulator
VSVAVVDFVLSDREAQVAEGMARGLSYGEIAAEMGVAVSTVRTHVHHVYQRLGAGHRGEFLVAYRRMKIPWAAAIMCEKTGKLSHAAWCGLIEMMLDALDEA